MKTNTYERFKKYAVTAGSLQDFLERYTKPEAHAGRGADYVAARIKSHQEDLDRYGFTFITHHDSKTGATVAYYSKERDKK